MVTEKISISDLAVCWGVAFWGEVDFIGRLYLVVDTIG